MTEGLWWAPGIQAGSTHHRDGKKKPRKDRLFSSPNPNYFPLPVLGGGASLLTFFLSFISSLLVWLWWATGIYPGSSQHIFHSEQGCTLQWLCSPREFILYHIQTHWQMFFPLLMHWKDIDLFLILLTSQVSDSSLVCLIVVLRVYMSVFMTLLFVWYFNLHLSLAFFVSNSLSLLFGHDCFFLLSQACPGNHMHWPCASCLVSFCSLLAPFTDLIDLSASLCLFLVNFEVNTTVVASLVSCSPKTLNPRMLCHS